MKLLFTLIFLFYLMACSEVPPPLESVRGNTMGTTYSILWPQLEPQAQAKSISEEVSKTLEQINSQMSTYDPSSELSVFNSMESPAQLNISEGLHEVLTMSLALHLYTQGYFDISVGPVVNLWGFGPDKKPINKPSVEETLRAKSQIGLAAISVGEGQVSKSEQRYLDLSAIAKGYAVDKVADILESNGIENYLVEIGGEMRVKGRKSPDLPWRVAVEKPDENQRNVQKIFTMKSGAMATSGDYRNYFEIEGVHYSHTIDPFTAQPVKHSLASVTIIKETCAHADALATAMLVMGAEKAKAFIEAHQIKAFLIERTEQGFKEYSSPAFERWQTM